MKKKKLKIEYFMNGVENKPISKREFLHKQKEDKINDCVSSVTLIKNRSFTRSEINSLVSQKILIPIKYKSEIYFKKDEVIKSFKHINKLPKCKEGDCLNPSISDNDGYCINHICPPPIPLILQYLNNIKKKEE